MKYRSILLLSFILLITLFLYLYWIKHQNSINDHIQKTTNSKTTKENLDLMFISLRFQHVAPESLEYFITITPDKFEECLKFLQENQYHFLSAKEVYDFIVNKVPVPHKSIWLTFDEGLESTYLYATPLLKKYNARATVFIGIAWIRKPYRLTNTQLKAMSKSGVWDIQSHGFTGNLNFPINAKGDEGNFYLSRLWQIDRPETIEEYKDRIKKDLNNSFKYLKENFKSEKLMFAYPFSENLRTLKNKNHNLKYLLECLDELNIIGIGTNDSPSIIINQSTQKHFISRLTVYEYTDFEVIFSGRYIR